MDLLYQIGLTLIPGIGNISGKKLVSYCGGVEAVFKEKKSALLKIPGIGPSTVKSIIDQSVFAEAEDEIKFIDSYKIITHFYLDRDYPHRLKNCEDSPMLIYYKGSSDLNHKRILGIIGTRKATGYGKKACKEFVEELSSMDVLIVSGLAYGIDTYAHKNAILHSLPTIGVLAHGLDRIYPVVNKQLAQKMTLNGGLLTEFRSKTKPDRENFPKRNRIVAGLCDAILVVESALKGGALITAEIANSYNRDVFAVPGRINDVYSEGCNYLVKTHRAALVNSANDIRYLMNWEESAMKVNTQKTLFVELNDDEQKVVSILKEDDTMSIDVISIQSGMSTSRVAAVLLNLEFKGVVQCQPGKVYLLS